MKKPIAALFGLLVMTAGSLLVLANQGRADLIEFDDDTYAAIAYSPATGKWGYAYDCDSRSSAEEAALSRCKAPDACIVTWVHNGFCALALGDDKSHWGVGWSFGDGASNVSARNRALAECRQRTTGARLVLCVCSLDVQQEVNR